MDYEELVSQARAQITEIHPDHLVGLGAGVTIVDVREPHEFALGAIPGSILISRGVLESEIGRHVPDLDSALVVVCSVGARSALAAVSLMEIGYSNVVNLAGGVEAWKSQGRPWQAPDTLTDEQRARYSRHTALAEVGLEGQRRLLESKVLLVGAGGLGSPVALYLAAAGVGELGVVDADTVDASNLQRQIVHGLDRIGSAKTASVTETVANLNPDVTVVEYRTRLMAGNAVEILSGYDVIVDGADNFPTRYLVNDASLNLGIPVVHGSIFRFEGQVSVFRPHQGPCYRCLFAEPPPPALAPNCAEAGVLGVLPGVIGSLQAVEVVKLLLGIGDDLTGRLLLYDALDQEFRELRIVRDPHCAACADATHPPPLVDYDERCVVG